LRYEDSDSAHAALTDSESIVFILNYDFDGNEADEQIIAYRNLLEIDSPVYVTYIVYDEKSKSRKRVWNAPCAASRPGTISLYAQDLTGDHIPCFVLTGMNSRGEHTMTVFKKTAAARNSRDTDSPPFTRIALLQIEGSISVQETERSLAYQQGVASGQPFTIVCYGHDRESSNMLDQLEIIYSYNQITGLYEQRKITRIPGAQIEQRKVRELLSGKPGVFEQFINGLWYYVSPQGTVDKSQYIYFDPAGKELIFFGDDTQQIFSWQHSTPTRYGLYLSTQNISVITLRRFLDIELESLESIRVRVFEDVRLKIAVNASWDGSYRRAGIVPKSDPNSIEAVKPHIEAVYDSTLGRIRFHADGFYELSSGGEVKKGRYVFFRVSGDELLEMRADDRTGGAASAQDNARTVYRVDRGRKNAADGAADLVTLSRVQLGVTGVEDMHEGQITMRAAP
jgi:hypothetical protein